MIHFWLEEEKASLDSTETFHDMLSIALKVLGRMPDPIVELCGPMSTGGAGTLEANMRRYKAAVQVLHEEGFNVFDPTPFQKAMIRISGHMENGVYNMDILHIFYHGVFNSGYIKTAYFLPDWESSKGATWERGQLESLNVEILEFPERLYKKVLESEEAIKV